MVIDFLAYRLARMLVQRYGGEAESRLSEFARAFAAAGISLESPTFHRVQDVLRNQRYG